MSGFRAQLSDHHFDPLPRLTRMMVVWSEICFAHLNTMGLSKLHPITVNPLIVRGFHKHPFTLKTSYTNNTTYRTEKSPK